MGLRRAQKTQEREKGEGSLHFSPNMFFFVEVLSVNPRSMNENIALARFGSPKKRR